MNEISIVDNELRIEDQIWMLPAHFRAFLQIIGVDTRFTGFENATYIRKRMVDKLSEGAASLQILNERSTFPFAVKYGMGLFWIDPGPRMEITKQQAEAIAQLNHQLAWV